jgi:hypothetical protein
VSSHRTTARGVLLLSLLLGVAGAASAAVPKKGVVPTLIFPVAGAVTYTDDFGEPRPGGAHQGNDLMAAKKTPVVAVEPGKVKFWTTSAAAGCMLYLYGDSGTTYMYIHLNNDLTMRNDNNGKCVPGVSYARGLKDGAKVQAGQLVGYVGDSGDANGVAPHLHFEVHPRGGSAVSPYPYLIRSTRLLFAASRGSTFSLSLRGTIVTTGVDQLKLKVTSLRAYPGGFTFQGVNRSLELVVPATALLQRKVNGVMRSVTAPLTTLQRKLPIQIWTSPAPCTLDAQMGRDGALSADRILVLR